MKNAILVEFKMNVGISIARFSHAHMKITIVCVNNCFEREVTIKRNTNTSFYKHKNNSIAYIERIISGNYFLVH